MKTKILTATILFALVFFMNLNVKPESLVLKNHYRTISTVITEKMKIDTRTQLPCQKNIYERNNDNELVNKQIYVWNAGQGWMPSCKYQYHYTISGKLAKIEYSEWNKSTSGWVDKGAEQY